MFYGNEMDMDKGLIRLYNVWILVSMTKQEYEKGKKYVKLINKFDKRIDWRVFATEINLDQRIEVGEFNKKEGGKVCIDKHEDQNNLKTSDIN